MDSHVLQPVSSIESITVNLSLVFSPCVLLPKDEIVSHLLTSLELSYALQVATRGLTTMSVFFAASASFLTASNVS